MTDAIAIVPVFNPEPGLVALCEGLLGEFAGVVVVDDGSVEDRERFGLLPPSVVLLAHEVNRGKGRAMKTAIEWVLANRPQARAVVFVDGDGQHSPEDARRVAEAAIANDGCAFGVRDFKSAGVPLRSRFGNVLTAFLVRLIYGFGIEDTQTGLRAFPLRMCPALLEIPGERYEYEMRLFGRLSGDGEALHQVPIKTIYVESNRSSHFRPVVDSYRVYKGLFGDSVARMLRFSASSVAGFLADNLVFAVAMFALQRTGMLRRWEILISLAVARAASATLNYACNRSFVFRSRTSFAGSFVRYWALVLLIAALSYVLTATLSALLDVRGASVTVVKVVVESALFILSYRLQKKWVFG